jgi:hypothetical protein
MSRQTKDKNQIQLALNVPNGRGKARCPESIADYWFKLIHKVTLKESKQLVWLKALCNQSAKK